MDHLDYPVTAKITFKRDEEESRTFHCDEATFTDPLGEWFGIFVNNEPIMIIPKDEIKYVEITYNGFQEESETQVTH